MNLNEVWQEARSDAYHMQRNARTFRNTGGNPHCRMLLAIKTTLEDEGVDLKNSSLNDEKWRTQNGLTPEMIIRVLAELENENAENFCKKAAIHIELTAVRMLIPIPTSSSRQQAASSSHDDDIAPLGAESRGDMDYYED